MLKNQVKGLKDQISAGNEVQKDLKALIEDYRQKVKEKDKEITALNNQLSKHTLASTDAGRVVAKLNEEVLELKKQVSKLSMENQKKEFRL